MAKNLNWLEDQRNQFYAGEKPSGVFRCFNISSYPLMTDRMCSDRAQNPELYSADCRGCPYWKKLRKEAKALAKKAAKAPVRIAYK